MNLVALERERARLSASSRRRECTIGILMFILVIGGIVAEFLIAAWVQGWRP